MSGKGKPKMTAVRQTVAATAAALADAELTKLYADTGIDLSMLDPVITPDELAPVMRTSVGALAQDRYRRRGIPWVRYGKRIQIPAGRRGPVPSSQPHGGRMTASTKLDPAVTGGADPPPEYSGSRAPGPAPLNEFVDSHTTALIQQFNGSACRCGYGETCACPACPFYANWWFNWEPPQDLLSQLRRRYEAKKRLPPLCHSGVRDPEGMDWWRR